MYANCMKWVFLQKLGIISYLSYTISYHILWYEIFDCFFLMSRGLYGLVCPSRTSERGGKGDCVKEGGEEEGERLDDGECRESERV